MGAAFGDDREGGQVKRMEFTTVKRTRSIPTTGQILVSTGQTVTPETVIARVETLPGRVLRTDAAGSLGVDPKTLDRWVLKNIGDPVSEGEAIAGRTDFFERRFARAPIDGVLAIVSRNLGYVYVREIIELGDSTGPVTINVVEQIKILPKDMGRWLNSGVTKGAITFKGQVLASNKTIVEKPIVCKSPMYGRIKEVSLEMGTITIAPIFDSLDILAYMGGKVVGILPGVGVEIEGDAVAIDGIWGLGGEAFGALKVIDGDLTEDSVEGFERGDVIAVNGTASYGALVQAYEKGVAGAVFAYLSSKTVLRLVGPHKNLGVTGDEEVLFPIVLTEGFLPSVIDDEILHTFKRYQGTVVSLRGTTHIRAGVIRPEIIIPVG